MRTTAVVFPEPNKYELRELELETPGPRDLVVKTLVTAISPGTERWTLRGKHIGSTFPCVPGYHRIGLVEEKGSEVTAFRVGDIVYGSAGRWTGEVKSMWGAHVGLSVGDHAGYKFVSSDMPKRLELETLSFAILAGVGNRGIRFLEVQPDEKVLIIGAGIIGICAARLSALRGAAPVLLDVDEERIEFVRKLGFSVLNSRQEGLEDTLRAIAPGGFEVAYDTVGDAATNDRVVQLMQRHGRLLLQAQYFDKERHAVDLDQIKIRELTVKTTCGTDDQDWIDTVANLRSRLLPMAQLITHRLEAADALQGYELLDKGKPFNLGIVFRWDERVKD